MKTLLSLLAIIAANYFLFSQDSIPSHEVEREYGDIIDYYVAPKEPKNLLEYLDSNTAGYYTATSCRYNYFAFYLDFVARGDKIDTNTIRIFPIYSCGNGIPIDSYVWKEFKTNIKDAMKLWKLKHYNILWRTKADKNIADSLEKAYKIPASMSSVRYNIVLKLSFGYELPFYANHNTISSGFKNED